MLGNLVFIENSSRLAFIVTLVAVKWIFSCVRALVRFQSLFALQRLSAESTHEKRIFVYTCVTLKLRLVRTDVTTDAADETWIGRMLATLVSAQRGVVGEDHPAHVTLTMTHDALVHVLDVRTQIRRAVILVTADIALMDQKRIVYLLQSSLPQMNSYVSVKRVCGGRGKVTFLALIRLCPSVLVHEIDFGVRKNNL